MALPTFVANSTVVAVAASATCTYPAGFAAGDLLLMLVSTDGTAVSTPTGFVAAGAITSGGGASVAVFRKTATGTETGTVTSTITGGTKGAATIAAYRPAAGEGLGVAVFTGGTDVDDTTTALSMTGGSFTTEANDLLGVFGLAVAQPAGSIFSAVVASASITQTGATLGTQTGRVGGRTGTNTLYYVLRDVAVTTGGTGAPTFAATAQGANATGAARFFAIRATSTPPGAGADQEVDAVLTVTLQGSAPGTWRQISGTPVTLSSTTVQNPTFKSPATVAGDSLVFGLTIGGAEDTVTITVRPHIDWHAVGTTWMPSAIEAL